MFRPINYLCYHGLVFLVSFSCCDTLNSFGVTITDYRKRKKKKGSAPGRNQTHDTQIIRVVLYLHATYFRITTTMCSTASTAIVLVKLGEWKGQSRNQKGQQAFPNLKILGRIALWPSSAALTFLD